jgi:hypothetical protein
VHETALPTFVHGGLQRPDGSMPGRDGLRIPRARGQHDQGVEDVGVQSGGRGQSVVPAFDGHAQPSGQRVVLVGLTAQMGHAERDVPGVVRRLNGQLAEGRVAGVGR